MLWIEVSRSAPRITSVTYRSTGGISREDDDIKVDNVICRTPARNAQNLDAVKNEILEMVDRAVSLDPSTDTTCGGG